MLFVFQAVLQFPQLHAWRGDLIREPHVLDADTVVRLLCFYTLGDLSRLHVVNLVRCCVD